MEKEKEKGKFSKNRYGDLRLMSSEIPEDAAALGDKLDRLIEEGRRAQSKAIWVHFRPDQAAHVEVAVGRKFQFHSVVSFAGTKHLKMVMILDAKTTFRSLQSLTNHYVKVEGVLVHQARDWSEPHVLVYRTVREGQVDFRFPTLAVRSHEMMLTAVERGMREECNVEVEAQGILGFWENRFGANDMICLNFGVLARLFPSENPSMALREHSGRPYVWLTVSEARRHFAASYEHLWLETSGVMTVSQRGQKNSTGFSTEMRPSPIIPPIVRAVDWPLVISQDDFVLEEQDMRMVESMSTYSQAFVSDYIEHQNQPF